VSAAFKKQEGILACPRCKSPMKEVLSIAPVQSDPGMVVYECPSCGYLTSVLTPPRPEPDDGSGGQGTPRR
jgi:transposase-like protein